MSHKTKIIISIIAVIVVVVFAFFSIRNKMQKYTDDKNIIEIGAILPLTGKYADSGNSIKAGLEYAREELNKNLNSKKKFMIEYYDNKSESKNTITGFNNLRNNKNIRCYFTALTDNSLLLKSHAIKEKVILFCIASSQEITEDAQQLVFRPCNTNQDEVDYLVDQLNKQSQPIVAFAQNTDAGLAYQNAFYKDYHGKILNWVMYDDNMDQVKSVSSVPQVQFVETIAVFGYSPTMGAIIKSLRENGYSGEIICNPGFYYPSVLTVAGESADGVKYLDYDLPYQTEKHKGRAVFARNKYNATFTAASYVAMVTLKLFDVYIENADYDAVSVGRAIAQEKEFHFDDVIFSTHEDGAIKFKNTLKTYSSKK